MPRSERKSWWSILARATSSGKKASRARESNGRGGAKAEAEESIKERVLAKLAEPLPSELKQQAARHSVDVVSYNQEDLEHLLLCSTPSRYSTSSSSTSLWTSSLDAADYAGLPALKASAHHLHKGPAPRGSTTSGIYSSCSSPTSNVIARLMGLGNSSSPSSSSPPASPYPHHQLKNKRAMADAPRSCSNAMPAKGSTRTPRGRNAHQGFLDEMESHLRQCDQALERIEAVMQLKKKLLYLSNSATTAANRNRHDVYNVRRDDPGGHDRNRMGHHHARSRSMDHTMTNSSRRYDHHHHHQRQQQQQLLQQDRAVMEITTPPPSFHFQHRRSLSDGGTPVFCPYDMELEMLNSRIMERDQSVRARLLNQTMASPSPSPPRTKARILKTNLASSRASAREEIHDIYVSLNESEQPSPVSVLDNSNHDSSEDDPACQREREPNRKKGAVVRALWADEPAAPVVVPQKPEPQERSTREEDDGAIVKAMDRRWSQGIGTAAEEVAARVECIILRRLVEETIVAVALGCARHRGRTRGDP